MNRIAIPNRSQSCNNSMYTSQQSAPSPHTFDFHRTPTHDFNYKRQIVKLVVSSMSFVASSTLAIKIRKRYRQLDSLGHSSRTSNTRFDSDIRLLIVALFSRLVFLMRRNASLYSREHLPHLEIPLVQFGLQGIQILATLMGLLQSQVIGAAPTPMYTFVLTLYAFLSVKHRMTRETFSRKLEWTLHWVIFLQAVTSAFFVVLTRNVNPLENGYVCTFLRGYPLNCESDPDRYGNCERGQNAVLYLIIIFYIPTLLCFIGMGVCLSSLSWYVFIAERRMQGPQDLSTTSRGCYSYLCYLTRENVPVETENSHKLHEFSMESLTQSSLYVLVFLLTHALNYVNVLLLGIGITTPAWVSTGRLILYPSGVFNILLYKRPKVKHLRKRHYEL